MKPFTLEDIRANPPRVLSRGRWANADLFLFDAGEYTWVIKDFSPCRMPVRYTIGIFMARRELQALKRLQGIPGIAADPFRLSLFALAYRYVPGTTLKEARRTGVVTPRFFEELEVLVQRMHERGIVHLDIRYMRNILITPEGEPALLDFQSGLMLDRIPRMFHAPLKAIDLSGVYKCWHNICPDTMGPERTALLGAVQKRRSLWIFKGYPLGTRTSRR
jgi:serine/threonine protein kinase